MSKHGGAARYRSVELHFPELYEKVVSGELPITHAFAAFKAQKAALAKAKEMQKAATGDLAAALKAARMLDREDLQKLREFIIAIMPAKDGAGDVKSSDKTGVGKEVSPAATPAWAQACTPSENTEADLRQRVDETLQKENARRNKRGELKTHGRGH